MSYSFVKDVLEFGLNEIQGLLNENKFRLDRELNDIHESINSHIKRCRNWSSNISFKDSNIKSLKTVFINLDIDVTPLSQKMDDSCVTEKIKLNNLNFDHHIVLRGQPGAGKTTSLKYLCNKFIDVKGLDDNSRFNYPLLIQFRELRIEIIKENQNSTTGISRSITEELLRIFGITLSKKLKKDKEKIDEKQLEREFNNIKFQIAVNLLDNQNIILILDGFDELENQDIKDKVAKEISEIVPYLNQSRIVLSTRTGEFNSYISSSTEFEIQALSEEQISNFSKKWLNSSEDAIDFLNKVKASPFYDTAIRPLTIAHLCAIYERTQDIPKKPKTVYRKVINLMLEEWDEQRLIKRPSNYANFESDRKYEFLCALSYRLTIVFNKSIFSNDMLIRAYNQICTSFGLPLGEARKVAKELETHSGLFIRSGYEQYIFAHKSIQEFLMGDYIVKLPELPSKDVLVSYPNEMALAVSLSSNPSLYLKKIMEKHKILFSGVNSFYSTFISRLMLEKPDFSLDYQTALKLIKLFSAGFNETTLEFLYQGIINPKEFSKYFENSIKNCSNFNEKVSKNYKLSKKKSPYCYEYIKYGQVEGPKKIIYPKV